MSKKEAPDLEAEELPVSSEYGPRWVYTATEGTISSTQWTYDWNQMRGKWHPQYCFRWNDLDSSYKDVDFVYEVPTDPFHHECINDGILFPNEIQTDSQTSDYTDIRRSRCRCTAFFVAMGIFLIASVAIPTAFYLLYSEDNPHDVIGQVDAELTLVRINFTREMLNKSSNEYKLLSGVFQSEVTKLYRGSPLNATYMACRVRSLREGSVKVHYNVYFDVVNRRIPSEDQIKDVIYSVDRDKTDTTLGVLGDLRFRIDSAELIDQSIVERRTFNDSGGENVIVGVKDDEDIKKNDKYLKRLNKTTKEIHGREQVDLNNILADIAQPELTTQQNKIPPRLDLTKPYEKVTADTRNKDDSTKLENEISSTRISTDTMVINTSSYTDFRNATANTFVYTTRAYPFNVSSMGLDTHSPNINLSAETPETSFEYNIITTAFPPNDSSLDIDTNELNLNISAGTPELTTYVETMMTTTNVTVETYEDDYITHTNQKVLDEIVWYSAGEIFIQNVSTESNTINQSENISHPTISLQTAEAESHTGASYITSHMPAATGLSREFLSSTSRVRHPTSVDTTDYYLKDTTARSTPEIIYKRSTEGFEISTPSANLFPEISQINNISLDHTTPVYFDDYSKSYNNNETVNMFRNSSTDEYPQTSGFGENAVVSLDDKTESSTESIRMTLSLHDERSEAAEFFINKSTDISTETSDTYIDQTTTIPFSTTYEMLTDESFNSVELYSSTERKDKSAGSSAEPAHHTTPTSISSLDFKAATDLNHSSQNPYPGHESTTFGTFVDTQTTKEVIIDEQIEIKETALNLTDIFSTSTPLTATEITTPSENSTTIDLPVSVTFSESDSNISTQFTDPDSTTVAYFMDESSPFLDSVINTRSAYFEGYLNDISSYPLFSDLETTTPISVNNESYTTLHEDRGSNNAMMEVYPIYTSSSSPPDKPEGSTLASFTKKSSTTHVPFIDGLGGLLYSISTESKSRDLASFTNESSTAFNQVSGTSSASSELYLNDSSSISSDKESATIASSIEEISTSLDPAIDRSTERFGFMFSDSSSPSDVTTSAESKRITVSPLLSNMSSLVQDSNTSNAGLEISPNDINTSAPLTEANSTTHGYFTDDSGTALGRGIATNSDERWFFSNNIISSTHDSDITTTAFTPSIIENGALNIVDDRNSDTSVLRPFTTDAYSTQSAPITGTRTYSYVADTSDQFDNSVHDSITTWHFDTDTDITTHNVIMDFKDTTDQSINVIGNTTHDYASTTSGSANGLGTSTDTSITGIANYTEFATLESPTGGRNLSLVGIVPERIIDEQIARGSTKSADSKRITVLSLFSNMSSLVQDNNTSNASLEISPNDINTSAPFIEANSTTRGYFTDDSSTAIDRGIDTSSDGLWFFSSDIISSTHDSEINTTAFASLTIENGALNLVDDRNGDLFVNDTSAFKPFTGASSIQSAPITSTRTYSYVADTSDQFDNSVHDSITTWKFDTDTDITTHNVIMDFKDTTDQSINVIGNTTHDYTSTTSGSANVLVTRTDTSITGIVNYTEFANFESSTGGMNLSFARIVPESIIDEQMAGESTLTPLSLSVSNTDSVSSEENNATFNENKSQHLEYRTTETVTNSRLWNLTRNETLDQFSFENNTTAMYMYAYVTDTENTTLMQLNSNVTNSSVTSENNTHIVLDDEEQTTIYESYPENTTMWWLYGDITGSSVENKIDSIHSTYETPENKERTTPPFDSDNRNITDGPVTSYETSTAEIVSTRTAEYTNDENNVTYDKFYRNGNPNIELTMPLTSIFNDTEVIVSYTESANMTTSTWVNEFSSLHNESKYTNQSISNETGKINLEQNYTHKLSSLSEQSIHEKSTSHETMAYTTYIATTPPSQNGNKTLTIYRQNIDGSGISTTPFTTYRPFSVEKNTQITNTRSQKIGNTIGITNDNVYPYILGDKSTAYSSVENTFNNENTTRIWQSNDSLSLPSHRTISFDGQKNKHFQLSAVEKEDRTYDLADNEDTKTSFVYHSDSENKQFNGSRYLVDNAFTTKENMSLVPVDSDEGNKLSIRSKDPLVNFTANSAHDLAISSSAYPSEEAYDVMANLTDYLTLNDVTTKVTRTTDTSSAISAKSLDITSFIHPRPLTDESRTIVSVTTYHKVHSQDLFTQTTAPTSWNAAINDLDSTETVNVTVSTPALRSNSIKNSTFSVNRSSASSYDDNITDTSDLNMSTVSSHDGILNEFFTAQVVYYDGNSEDDNKDIYDYYEYSYDTQMQNQHLLNTNTTSPVEYNPLHSNTDVTSSPGESQLLNKNLSETNVPDIDNMYIEITTNQYNVTENGVTYENKSSVSRSMVESRKTIRNSTFLNVFVNKFEQSNINLTNTLTSKSELRDSFGNNDMTSTPASVFDVAEGSQNKTILDSDLTGQSSQALNENSDATGASVNTTYMSKQQSKGKTDTGEQGNIRRFRWKKGNRHIIYIDPLPDTVTTPENWFQSGKETRDNTGILYIPPLTENSSTIGSTNDSENYDMTRNAISETLTSEYNDYGDMFAKENILNIHVSDETVSASRIGKNHEMEIKTHAPTNVTLSVTPTGYSTNTNVHASIRNKLSTLYIATEINDVTTPVSVYDRMNIHSATATSINDDRDVTYMNKTGDLEIHTIGPFTEKNTANTYRVNDSTIFASAEFPFIKNISNVSTSRDMKENEDVSFTNALNTNVIGKHDHLTTELVTFTNVGKTNLKNYFGFETSTISRNPHSNVNYVGTETTVGPTEQNMFTEILTREYVSDESTPNDLKTTALLRDITESFGPEMSINIDTSPHSNSTIVARTETERANPTAFILSTDADRSKENLLQNSITTTKHVPADKVLPFDEQHSQILSKEDMPVKNLSSGNWGDVKTKHSVNGSQTGTHKQYENLNTENFYNSSNLEIKTTKRSASVDAGFNIDASTSSTPPSVFTSVSYITHGYNDLSTLQSSISPPFSADNFVDHEPFSTDNIKYNNVSLENHSTSATPFKSKTNYTVKSNIRTFGDMFKAQNRGITIQSPESSPPKTMLSTTNEVTTSNVPKITSNRAYLAERNVHNGVTNKLWSVFEYIPVKKRYNYWLDGTPVDLNNEFRIPSTSTESIFPVRDISKQNDENKTADLGREKDVLIVETSSSVQPVTPLPLSKSSFQTSTMLAGNISMYPGSNTFAYNSISKEKENLTKTTINSNLLHTSRHVYTVLSVTTPFASLSSSSSSTESIRNETYVSTESYGQTTETVAPYGNTVDQITTIQSNQSIPMFTEEIIANNQSDSTDAIYVPILSLDPSKQDNVSSRPDESLPLSVNLNESNLVDVSEISNEKIVHNTTDFDKTLTGFPTIHYDVTVSTILQGNDMENVSSDYLNVNTSGAATFTNISSTVWKDGKNNTSISWNISDELTFSETSSLALNVPSNTSIENVGHVGLNHTVISPDSEYFDSTGTEMYNDSLSNSSISLNESISIQNETSTSTDITDVHNEFRANHQIESEDHGKTFTPGSNSLGITNDQSLNNETTLAKIIKDTDMSTSFSLNNYTENISVEYESAQSTLESAGLLKAESQQHVHTLNSTIAPVTINVTLATDFENTTDIQAYFTTYSIWYEYWNNTERSLHNNVSGINETWTVDSKDTIQIYTYNASRTSNNESHKGNQTFNQTSPVLESIEQTTPYYSNSTLTTYTLAETMSPLIWNITTPYNITYWNDTLSTLNGTVNWANYYNYFEKNETLFENFTNTVTHQNASRGDSYILSTLSFNVTNSSLNNSRFQHADDTRKENVIAKASTNVFNESLLVLSTPSSNWNTRNNTADNYIPKLHNTVTLVNEYQQVTTTPFTILDVGNDSLNNQNHTLENAVNISKENVNISSARSFIRGIPDYRKNYQNIAIENTVNDSNVNVLVTTSSPILGVGNFSTNKQDSTLKNTVDNFNGNLNVSITHSVMRKVEDNRTNIEKHTVKNIVTNFNFDQKFTTFPSTITNTGTYSTYDQNNLLESAANGDLNVSVTASSIGEIGDNRTHSQNTTTKNTVGNSIVNHRFETSSPTMWGMWNSSTNNLNYSLENAITVSNHSLYVSTSPSFIWKMEENRTNSQNPILQNYEDNSNLNERVAASPPTVWHMGNYSADNQTHSLENALHIFNDSSYLSSSPSFIWEMEDNRTNKETSTLENTVDNSNMDQITTSPPTVWYMGNHSADNHNYSFFNESLDVSTSSPFLWEMGDNRTNNENYTLENTEDNTNENQHVTTSPSAVWYIGNYSADNHNHSLETAIHIFNNSLDVSTSSSFRWEMGDNKTNNENYTLENTEDNSNENQHATTSPPAVWHMGNYNMNMENYSLENVIDISNQSLNGSATASFIWNLENYTTNNQNFTSENTVDIFNENQQVTTTLSTIWEMEINDSISNLNQRLATNHSTEWDMVENRTYTQNHETDNLANRKEPTSNFTTEREHTRMTDITKVVDMQWDSAKEAVTPVMSEEYVLRNYNELLNAPVEVSSTTVPGVPEIFNSKAVSGHMVIQYWQSTNATIGHPLGMAWNALNISGWRYIILERQFTDGMSEVIAIFRAETMKVSYGNSSLFVSPQTEFDQDLATIYLDIRTLRCQDEAVYILRVYNTTTQVKQRVVLNVFREPVVEIVSPEELFSNESLDLVKCKADLGYPYGQLFMSVSFDEGENFETFFVSEENMNVRKFDVCIKEVFVNFTGYFNQPIQKNVTRVQCGVYDSEAIQTEDGYIVSETKALRIIPGNVCDGKGAGLFSHPYASCSFIECPVRIVKPCPVKTCFDPLKRICT